VSILSSAGVDATSHQLVGSGPVALPRVNLLPPEIALRRRFRRIQYGLGGAVLAVAALVVGGFVLASGAVSSAHGEVNSANAENTRLQAETARYSSVTAVYAQAAAAQAMLTDAMGQEVRYSRMLSDLSLSVPENVWLTQLSFSQAAAQPTVGSTQPGIGTMTVAGKGFSHDDVAVWLESLAGQKTLANPYFSSSTEVLIGPRKAVDFASTAQLTNDALSGRYTKPAGG
jgi:Tfp pilus assembly protein PilN